MSKELLTTKIGVVVQTGQTDVHKPVRPVWVTSSKCRFNFTIA
jgi:hypothetical protein